jgi:hypothetical protein
VLEAADHERDDVLSNVNGRVDISLTSSDDQGVTVLLLYGRLYLLVQLHAAYSVPHLRDTRCPHAHTGFYRILNSHSSRAWAARSDANE